MKAERPSGPTCNRLIMLMEIYRLGGADGIGRCHRGCGTTWADLDWLVKRGLVEYRGEPGAIKHVFDYHKTQKGVDTAKALITILGEKVGITETQRGNKS